MFKQNFSIDGWSLQSVHMQYIQHVLHVVTSKCAHARHVVCIIEYVISTESRYIFTADQIYIFLLG